MCFLVHGPPYVSEGYEQPIGARGTRLGCFHKSCSTKAVGNLVGQVLKDWILHRWTVLALGWLLVPLFHFSRCREGPWGPAASLLLLVTTRSNLGVGTQTDLGSTTSLEPC